MRRTRLSLGLLLLAACSSGNTPVTEPSSAPPTASVTAEPVATAEPTATATAEPVVDAPPVSTERPPSGRPPVSYEKADKITETVGASPVVNFVLKSENARFKVPEWALSEGVLLTFLVDKKATKKAKGGAGSVFRLQAQNPPAETYSTVVSAGPKFELKLPTAKVGSPNLAIGTPKKDEKGRDIVEWKVIAPKAVADGFATFELTEFTDTMFQITSEAPSP
jgi:hypothetical protein